MKRLLFIAAIAGLACSCGGSGSSTTTDSAATTPAATTPAGVPDTAAKAVQASLKDGLMTLKDGKLMIVRNGAWAVADSAVSCTNGRKVSPDGTVSKGDKKRKLEEGMMIDKDGQLMDKDGKPMDTSGWD